MQISVAWMNSILDRPANADEISDVLTNVGFPCEGRVELPGGDVRLDIEITSNRGDCVSLVGLAREFAASTGRRLSMPAPKSKPAEGDASRHASVIISAPEACAYLSGRVILGLRVGPSPSWLRERIESVGLRSVSNVVDVTNFVLMALGQPLHAFDLAKLASHRIEARKARAGETLKLLDGNTVKLTPAMLVIADAQRPVALAGVMGGADTEVTSGTTDIILEAAVFDPATVRSASRSLAVLTDASYRFERGIHPATVSAAADLAASLIVEVAGGKWCAAPLIAGAPVPALRSITLRPQRCRSILGCDISVEQMEQILARLDLAPVQQGGEIHCTAPAHRLDLKSEIDLVEEIIRHHGLDRLTVKDRLSIEVRGPQPEVAARRRVDESLVGAGFHEVVTFTFISTDEGQAFLPPKMELLLVQDDRRKAEPALRPSIIPSLIRCRRHNQDLGHADMRLFEHAAVFALASGRKIENVNLGLLIDVSLQSDSQTALRGMRSAVENALRAAGGQALQPIIDPLGDSITWFEPGSAAAVRVGSAVMGTYGLLSHSLQSKFGLRNSVVVGELGIEKLFARSAEGTAAVSLSSQPAVERDLTIILPEETHWARVESTVRGAIETSLPTWLESLAFLGTYRGKQIGPGRKSTSMRFTFRAGDRTLRREDVDPAIFSLIEILRRDLGAEVRT